jgi:nucleotide-binding universal stress UspA family protein
MTVRVLVGVDGSQSSVAAVDVAIDLVARHPDATLAALHVVNVVPSSGNVLRDLPGHLGFEPAVVSEEVSRSHDEAGRVLLSEAKSRADARGVPVLTILDHGAVSERIEHHASQADLLVLGRHGETHERFPGQGGSTVHGALASGARSVLLVAPAGGPVRGVVLGYDGSDAAGHTLSALRGLGPTAGSPVHAVHVQTGGVDDVDLDEVNRGLPGYTVYTHRVAGDSVGSTLVEAARQHGANTLVFGFRGRSRLKDFAVGRSWEKLLTSGALHLLVAY